MSARPFHVETMVVPISGPTAVSLEPCGGILLAL